MQGTTAEFASDTVQRRTDLRRGLTFTLYDV
jgi:hypothetical protein